MLETSLLLAIAQSVGGFWMRRLQELSQCGVNSIEHDAKLYQEWMDDE